MEDDRHLELTKARRLLIRAYVLHVIWFAIMCAFTASQWSEGGLKASVLLTLVTVPPVLHYTVRVHTLCRAIDPAARTVGWVPVLVTTLILSPFESGLVLPLKNLWACNKLLQASASPVLHRETGSSAGDGPNSSSKPTPLRGAA